MHTLLCRTEAASSKDSQDSSGVICQKAISVIVNILVRYSGLNNNTTDLDIRAYARVNSDSIPVPISFTLLLAKELPYVQYTWSSQWSEAN